MQRNCTQIKKWEIAEFIFIAIVGTLLHFVYDWSGQNPAVGIIAPVSESTWEHLKLLFMPALLFTLIQGVPVVNPAFALSSHCIGVLALSRLIIFRQFNISSSVISPLSVYSLYALIDSMSL